MNFLRNLFKFSKPKTFPGIIAAKVISIEKHPDADRVRIIKLDGGHQRVIFPIVCGAFNFEVGAMVALALPGARIAQNIHSATHEPFLLEKATIRGIESQGMICAAFELALSQEPEKGIILLKDNTSPGNEFTSDMIKAL